MGARKQRLREDEAKVKMHLPRLQRPLSSGQACFSVPTALHRPPNMTPPLIRSESSRSSHFPKLHGLDIVLGTKLSVSEPLADILYSNHFLYAVDRV